ncbi:MAG: carbamoyltransferase [Deltaproteobacteria bacterium]|nr:carbamoyltransferase [Deltaproteobacteria bacterium]
MTTILGVSAYYHDSAAAIISDGRIVAAAQEERFTRKKHDEHFPENSIRYCLQEAGVGFSDLDSIVFYEKPLVKFERLLETYLSYAPKGIESFFKAIPVWLKEKLYLKTILKKEIAKLAGVKTKDIPPLRFAEHHQSHAASAFFPSPFERAAVLCMDGVGEWATTSVWHGVKNELTPKWEIRFPHSLGLLYTAFTYYTGFKVNSGEYKLMGLAPYGEPRYTQLILDNLIDLKDDGTFRLNMDYFNFAQGLTMTGPRFNELFDGAPRKPSDPVTQKDMDIARSIQVVTEEVVLRLGKTVHRELGEENLCLAGGVALNCVANGRLLKEGPFKNLWIQPASGDAGGAIGAALAVWHQHLGKPRTVNGGDGMTGAYLGPRYSSAEIEAALTESNAVYRQVNDQEIFPQVARILAEENVVGWVQGRMEFGPRALGNRSIIGDPRSAKMQSVMNLKIKYRESFRPFAPANLAERVSDYFEIDRPSPYMLLVAPVSQERRIPASPGDEKLFGIEKLKVPRSQVPAITHVDYSARVQTVHAETNPRFHRLLEAFESETQCPLLINTSFNVRGEPIVCTPSDAYRCFMRTEMDYLVIENYIIAKRDQPLENRTRYGAEEFEPD